MIRKEVNYLFFALTLLLTASCQKSAETHIVEPPPTDTTIVDGSDEVLVDFCGTGKIYAWGDSFISGAGAPFTDRFHFLTTAQLGHKVEPMGIGGETSTGLKNRMTIDTVRLKRPAIIWTGRNNYRSTETVRADLREMVKALREKGKHEKFIIVGPVTGNYPSEEKGQSGFEKMMLLDSLLQIDWKEHYISAYKVIMSKTVPADSVWTNRGLIPQRFRNGNDAIHFGLEGNTEISLAVAAKVNFCR